MVDSFAVAELAGRRVGRDGERIKLSPRTLEKRLCTLSLALQAAQRRGWIEHLPRFPKLRARYSPRQEHLRDYKELLKLCNSLPLDRADWVYTAVFSGLRPINLEALRAYVDADPFGRRPWIVLKSSKTRDADGVLARMPTPLARRLRERFEREQLRPGDLILPHWNKDNRSAALRLRARKLGIAAQRASDFRRTCGSWAAHGLGTLTVGLKEYLRHTTFDMLSRVYARALPPGFTDVSRALGAMAARKRSRPKKQALPPAGDLAGGIEGAPSPAGSQARHREKEVAPGGVASTAEGRRPNQGDRRGTHPSSEETRLADDDM